MCGRKFLQVKPILFFKEKKRKEKKNPVYKKPAPPPPTLKRNAFSNRGKPGTMQFL